MRTSALPLAGLLSCALAGLLPHAALAAEPSNYSVTSVGNSFSGASNRWMQNFFIRTKVQPDGTVNTWGHWDEGGKKSGDYGSIGSGKPGEITPAKFRGIRGLGMNAAGNLCVAMSEQGSVLRSLTTARKLRWELRGEFFCDVAETGPNHP